MNEEKAMAGSKKQPGLRHMVLLVICGIALNFMGLQLSGLFGWSIYLDTLGTVLAAALGGYLPGILVGYATNLISGVTDITNAYYGSVNALVGLAAAYFTGKGYWKKLWKALLTVPCFALIGGVLGSLLSWCLYEMSPDLSVPLVRSLYEQGMGPFGAQLIGGILIDLLDKALIVLMAVLALRAMPAEWKSLLHYEGWRQAPLTEEIRAAAEHRSLRGSSLRVRLLMLIAVSVLLVGIAATSVSGILFHRNTIEDHKKLSAGVTNLVASVIDPGRVDEYLTLGDDAAGYSEIESQLYTIRSSSPDIEYIYVYQIRPDGCHVVFDLDTEDVAGSEPGELIPFDESFAEYIPALLAGEPIEPIVTNDTYGWLLTAYQPVYDDQGVCQCYAAADISMNRLSAIEAGFLARVVSLFLGIFLVALFLGFWLAEYSIILPINTMTLAAGSFAYDSEEARQEGLDRFHALDIRTGDEIESLYHAVGKTMKDAVAYVKDINAKTETITKMQNGLILVLADMVESRDKCTGDHVRKTAAYAEIIMKHMRKMGIYPDELTDEFVLDVIHSAPLHDIGKIHVSDVLLNKPGKLTDDEFSQMKSHTTAGGEIIDRAIEMVGGESGYLNEARNLAAYHHERWDGKGYPNGIAGNDIPLSARIMAVADVFDALVSRRSYKPPFDMERAFEIIHLGAGSQFDPEVVRAFEDGAEEAQRIAEEHLGGDEADENAVDTKA